MVKIASVKTAKETKRPTQRSIDQRWTPELAKEWTPISMFFLDHYTDLNPPITSQEAILIIHLMRYKWHDEPPYPAFKTLAKKMGISVTAVRGHARKLEQKKYLKRQRRIDDTNLFYLEPLFAELEKLKHNLDPHENAQDSSVLSKG